MDDTPDIDADAADSHDPADAGADGPADAGADGPVDTGAGDPVDPTDQPTPCAYTEYREGPDVDDLPATGDGATGLEADVWSTLYEIEDPEMPISIVDLGLIYGVSVEDGTATVDMTLTYSGCPARDMLLGDVERAVAAVDGVESVDLRLVWSPGWTVEMVTEAGKDDLREFGLSV